METKSRYIYSLFTFVLLFFFSSCDTKEEPTDPSDIIELQILDSGANTIFKDIISDGETVVILQAKIPTNADEGFRTVTFKKSGGEFHGIDSEDGTRIVDNDGIAQIELKVPLNEDILFASAEIGKEANVFKSEASLDLVPITEVISLKLLNDQGQEISTGIQADGYSSIFLEATINERLNSIEQVKFLNSGGGAFQGVFTEEVIKTLNDMNKAIIELVVPVNVNELFFKVHVKDKETFFDEKKLQLDRAYADEIIIEPKNAVMNLNSENEISVFLKRNQGFVSVGTSVEFEAFQLINGIEKPVGRFLGLSEALSDENGKITTNFKTDTKNIDVAETIFIRVTALNDMNQSFNTKIQIDIE